MKNISIKYRRIQGCIALLSYLLIFILNVIHFHYIDLNSSTAINAGDISKQHSNNPESKYCCIVYQNFCSLNTTIFPGLISFSSFDNCRQRFPVESKFNYFNNFNLITNHFRAPPLST
jgi:hypothetical protein